MRLHAILKLRAQLLEFKRTRKDVQDLNLIIAVSILNSKQSAVILLLFIAKTKVKIKSGTERQAMTETDVYTAWLT